MKTIHCDPQALALVERWQDHSVRCADNAPSPAGVQHYAERVAAFSDLRDSLIREDSQTRFRLECGPMKSSWKAWQRKCFEYVRLYDGCIFTAKEIDEITQQLSDIASPIRFSEPLRRPDWDFFEKYGQDPYIGMGEGCYVTFRLIRGYAVSRLPGAWELIRGDEK